MAIKRKVIFEIIVLLYCALQDNKSDFKVITFLLWWKLIQMIYYLLNYLLLYKQIHELIYCRQSQHRHWINYLLFFILSVNSQDRDETTLCILAKTTDAHKTGRLCMGSVRSHYSWWWCWAKKSFRAPEADAFGWRVTSNVFLHNFCCIFLNLEE